MGGNRDGYSNFAFFQAIVNTAISGAATGNTVDLQGYDTATLIVEAGLCSTGVAATSDFKLVLQHGLASAAGVSAWSLVPNSQLIHSVVGGYDSTASTGLFDYVTQSYVNGSDAKLGIVGYKKDHSHRYIRLYVSVTGTVSAVPIGGTWILGNPNNWAVNEPVNT
jgi:hypothetical protein